MSDKKVKNRKKVAGGAGTTAGRDLKISGVSGQVAVGNDNTQTQTITQLSSDDKKNLSDNLLQLQKDIAKTNLPPDEASIVNGNVAAAIKETKKEDPDSSKLKDKVQEAVDTLKENVGKEKVSRWDSVIKIAETLAKVGLKILV